MSDIEPLDAPEPEAEPIIEWALRDDDTGAVMFGMGTEASVPALAGWSRVADVNAALRDEAVRQGTEQAQADANLAAAKEVGIARAAEAQEAQRAAILDLASAGGFDPATLAAALGQSHVLTPADLALPPSEGA
jgi:hypothetical protein